MNNIDLLARWLDDDVEVKIHHTYGTSDFEFRINYEPVNLDHLQFFNDPLGLCRDAAELIDANYKDLAHPVAGKILSEYGQVLFRYFPGSYGFRAGFSLLAEDKYIDLADAGATFEQQAQIILGPGWHDTVDDRFTKFELLRDRFKVEAAETLDIVRAIEKELIEGQRSGPQNDGGHTSDHFTWYQDGLGACELILAKYGR